MSATETKYSVPIFTNYLDGRQTVRWENSPELPFQVTFGLHKHLWTDLPFEIEQIAVDANDVTFKLKNPELVQPGVEYPCSVFANRFEDIEREISRILERLDMN
jgi:hypothetical protein